MLPEPAIIESYLHEHIPLTRAMGVRVLSVDAAGLRVAAPLAPNINHRQSVFGGSATAIGMIAAWALIHARLQDIELPARLVIQRQTMEFERPIVGDFEAFAPAPSPEDWERFEAMLRRRGKGRLTLECRLECGGERVALFNGDYVAVATD